MKLHNSCLATAQTGVQRGGWAGIQTTARIVALRELRYNSTAGARCPMRQRGNAVCARIMIARSPQSEEGFFDCEAARPRGREDKRAASSLRMTNSQ
jgi:hypothetical protein